MIMICEIHPSRQLQSKCEHCDKFLCAECQKIHRKENPYHEILRKSQLCEEAKSQINEQLHRIQAKINDLNTLGDYEVGENIIDACHRQIDQFMKQYFEKIKIDYRKICDSYWNFEHNETIKNLQTKKNILKGWKEILKNNPSKAIIFQYDVVRNQIEEVHSNNKIDSDEELLESNQSFLYNSQAPKICFNEFALRRLNELLGKVIFISQKSTKKPKKQSKKIQQKYSSMSYKEIEEEHPIACCKFLEGTNILYEYCTPNLLDENGNNNNQQMILRKVQFRQFITPMRAVSLTINGQIYLIGGQSIKDRKMSRQIWYFDKQYNTMRIVCLLKKSRVSHTVCTVKRKSNNQNNKSNQISQGNIIYVFGGKNNKSLERIDLKNKVSEQIGFYDQQIVGASMIEIRNKLYILGGQYLSGLPNSNILIFDLDSNIFLANKIPLNYEEFKLPICPILSEQGSDIAVLGGYFQHEKNTYANCYPLSYNIQNNYISQFGKTCCEIMYPIMSNGDADCLFYIEKEQSLCGIVELKRENSEHGPNFGVIFSYGLKDGRNGLDLLSI